MADARLSHAVLTDPDTTNDAVLSLLSAPVDADSFPTPPAAERESVTGAPASVRTLAVRELSDTADRLRPTPSGAPLLVVVLDGRVETVPVGRGGVGHEVLGRGQCRLVAEGADVVLRRTRTCASARVCVVWLGEAADADLAPSSGAPDDPPHLPDYYYGYDERYAAVYEAGGATWETPEPNEALVHALDKLGVAPGRIIDLGCGEGRDSVYLATRGFDVVAVDVSAAALSLGRARAAEAGVDVTFLERDVTTLAHLPAERYDVAINMGCLHMMPDPSLRRAHLDRVRELLPPDGLFLVAHCREKWLDGFYSVPDYASVGEVVPGRVIPRRVRMRDGGTAMIPLPLVPYKESATRELRDEVESCGFRLVADLSARTDAFGNTSVLAFAPAARGDA